MVEGKYVVMKVSKTRVKTCNFIGTKIKSVCPKIGKKRIFPQLLVLLKGN